MNMQTCQCTPVLARRQSASRLPSVDYETDACLVATLATTGTLASPALSSRAPDVRHRDDESLAVRVNFAANGPDRAQAAFHDTRSAPARRRTTPANPAKASRVLIRRLHGRLLASGPAGLRAAPFAPNLEYETSTPLPPNSVVY